ncbi:MAG: hypothetical protein IOD05_02565 [Rhodobacter sp.]|nr:hypothetical protein [Rhodobacter sp.]MCA3500080.1 hypothetical protein [Rhodobacter sp.]MCA3502147.1 hypothetical protein [Rhodobacter sp.]MCA3517536.1 hypothetical protein [Rhodobacter sp.]
MDDPGNLLAEFFNARPFIHHQLEGGLKVFHRLRCGLDLVHRTLPKLSLRLNQIFRRLPVQIFCRFQKIDGRRLV